MQNSFKQFDPIQQSIYVTLDETANYLADRLVLNAVAKKGSVSLEEAEFYDRIAHDVVFGAATEFIPDVSMIQESAGEEMLLTAEDGTVYKYNSATGALERIEGTGSANDDSTAVEDAQENNIQESTEIKKEELSESRDIVSGDDQQQIELTESQRIVTKLIQSLQA